jgi:peptidoglycan hydrolase CwlO-like protein
MKIKHKLLSDYQYTTSDKKIFLIKSGTILEEFKYSVKGESIEIDKDIVNGNPQFFEVINWQSELLQYLKANKIPQPAQISKKLVPFIEDILLSSSGTTKEVIKEIIKEVEVFPRDIKEKEESLNKRESEINQMAFKLEEWENDLNKINTEITEWEASHWKMRRMNPPSAITD